MITFLGLESNIPFSFISSHIQEVQKLSFVIMEIQNEYCINLLLKRKGHGLVLIVLWYFRVCTSLWRRPCSS